MKAKVRWTAEFETEIEILETEKDDPLSLVDRACGIDTGSDYRANTFDVLEINISGETVVGFTPLSVQEVI